MKTEYVSLLVVLFSPVLVQAGTERNASCSSVYNVEHYHQASSCCTNESHAGKYMEDIKAQLAALQTKMQDQEIKMEALKSEVSSLKKTVPRRAFHATGSQRDIHPGTIIQFGNVKTNLHGDYNPANSIFTCKNSGLYLFYVTMSTYNRGGYGQVSYQIVKDGAVKAEGFTNYVMSGSMPVSSLFAMIRCSPGNHIWVKQGSGRPSWKQGMYENRSQFGGFQIAN